MAQDIFYRFGDFRFDAIRGQLWKGKQLLSELGGKPLEVFRVFLTHPKEVISRHVFFDQVWPDTFVQDQALDQCVYKLRQMLGDTQPWKLIVSRTGGFEFGVAVQRVGPEGQEGALYEQGRHFFQRATTPDVQEAIKYYQMVTEFGGDCAADAYAGIAESLVLLGSFAHQSKPAREAMEEARSAASEAIRLDAENPDAHAALASISALYDWDWTSALNHFRRSVARPVNPLVKPMVRAWYGNCLAGRGEFEAARTEIDQARSDNSISTILAALSGRVAYLARDFELALRECDAAIHLEPNLYLGYIFKGHTLRHLGKYAEAERCFNRANELTGNNPVCFAEEAHLLGLQERYQEARAILTQIQTVAESRYVSPHVFALIHIGLGEYNVALKLLEQCCEAREAWMVFLTSDPVYDPLRTYPRFAELVQRVGFVQS